MNVDPATIGLRQYLALMHGWNAEMEVPARDFSRLKRAMDAHTVH